MLGIVSMAGNALKAFGNTHPAVKWGVVVLAFLLATEFVGKEGISLWVQAETARYTVERQINETKSALVQKCSAMAASGMIGTDAFKAECSELDPNLFAHMNAPPPKAAAPASETSEQCNERVATEKIRLGVPIEIAHRSAERQCATMARGAQ